MKDGMYHYDRDGKPIDLMTWAELMESGGESYRRVAFTTIGDEPDDVRVSTVWIGIPYLDVDESDGPLIFETLVAGGDLDGQMWHWSSVATALRGHEAVVDKVRGA